MVAALLSGCAETAKIGAAGDIRAFLIAIRDGDHAAFDAHVDRTLLKTQIRSRLLAALARRGDAGGDLAALGLVLARPLADSLSDSLIQPDVFRAVAEYYGYSPATPIPGDFAIASSLRVIDDSHVCVAKGPHGPCLLIFRDEDGVWRLIGFEGDPSMLRPPKP
jgi:hypothetical protein